MKDIVIVGSSGFAKETLFLIKEINNLKKKEWNFLGFINENVGDKFAGFNVIMNDEQLISYEKKLHVLIAIASPALLYKLAKKFQGNKNLLFPNIIHPSCIGDWENINIGIGNIFTAGNILTTDICIKNFNIFNLNGTVGHDSIIGSFNIFNPTTNISGNVNIKDRVFIGTGAQILQGLSLCDDVTVGASALVTKNIENPGIYIGSPAKLLRK